MLSSKGVDYSKILRRYDVDLQAEVTPEELAKKMLPSDPVFKKVAEEVLYMRLKTVGPAVNDALKTKSPLDVINNGLVAGMEIVSSLYSQHVYYLPEIMLAAKTMEIGIALAEKQLEGGKMKMKADVIMHTAEGDVHDIGKNIAVIMTRAAGFEVHDMGKDVPVDDVVAKTKEIKPLFVSGTALMTTTMSAFPRIAAKFKENKIEVPLMGCGGAVNREYANSYDLGIYSDKAAQTPPIAEKLLAGYDWKKVRAEWDQIVGGGE